MPSMLNLYGILLIPISSINDRFGDFIKLLNDASWQAIGHGAQIARGAGKRERQQGHAGPGQDVPADNKEEGEGERGKDEGEEV